MPAASFGGYLRVLNEIYPDTREHIVRTSFPGKSLARSSEVELAGCDTEFLDYDE